MYKIGRDLIISCVIVYGNIVSRGHAGRGMVTPSILVLCYSFRNVCSVLFLIEFELYFRDICPYLSGGV